MEFDWKSNHIRAFNHFLDFEKSGRGKSIIGKEEHKGKIYVGGFYSADPDYVSEKKFSHIIHLDPVVTVIEDKNVLELSIDYFYDEPKCDLIKILPKCFKFLDDAFSKVGEETRILIHCNSGASRSAAVCIAYIMKKRI